MRNLLIFILVLVAVWWVRRALSNVRRGSGPTASGKTALNQPEPMLACLHCGVHVPESEGVRDGEAFYCCEDHRRQSAGR